MNEDNNFRHFQDNVEEIKKKADKDYAEEMKRFGKLEKKPEKEVTIELEAVIEPENEEHMEPEPPDELIEHNHNKKEVIIGMALIIAIISIAFVIVIDYFELVDYPNLIDMTPTPLTEVERRVTNLKEISQENVFIIYTNGKYKGEFYNGSNIPTEIQGEKDTSIEFDCWLDETTGKKHFFGAFQPITATELYVQVNVVGHPPMSSGLITEGNSVIFEGECLD